MIDQLIIGNKHSYDDYEASVKERTINAPTKKKIKETVPFSNTTYDFSAINGEIYWDERSLEYVFEITANTPEELEDKKQAFLAWVMNVAGESLEDPFIPDYHFVATFDDVGIDDSEIEKTTIGVTFSAYPYMIANAARLYDVRLSAGEAVDIVAENKSSHRLTPTFASDVAFTVTKDGIVFSVPSGETKDDSFKLDVGYNALTLQATENGTVTIFFYEEVF